MVTKIKVVVIIMCVALVWAQSTKNSQSREDMTHKAETYNRNRLKGGGLSTDEGEGESYSGLTQLESEKRHFTTVKNYANDRHLLVASELSRIKEIEIADGIYKNIADGPIIDERNEGTVSTSPSGSTTWLGGWGTGGCTSGGSYWYFYYFKDYESIDWVLNCSNTSTDYDLYLYKYSGGGVGNLLAYATSTGYPDHLQYSDPNATTDLTFLEVRYYSGPTTSEFYLSNVKNPIQPTPSGSIYIMWAMYGHPAGNPTDGVEGYNPLASSEPSHWYNIHTPAFWQDSLFRYQITGAAAGDYDLYVFDDNMNFITSATGVSYPDVTGWIDGSIHANQYLWLQVYAYSGINAEYRLDYAGTEPIGGPTLVQLVSDEAVTTSTDPSYYKYFQTYYDTYWAAVGVRSSSDWDIALYTDTLFNNLVASSWGVGVVDFVVADYNHCPYGWQGVLVDRYSGSASARVEYEDYTETLNIGYNTNIEWPADDVIEMWDVSLSSGHEYHFVLDITSGSVDLGIALFKSNGASYYANRFDAEVLVDNNGNGGDESFYYMVPQSDVYGIAVFANNGNSGWFNINIVPTGVEELVADLQPQEFDLSQNSPNPVHTRTTIHYSLEKSCDVILKIYDAGGRKVTTLINDVCDAGNYRIDWDIRNIPKNSLPNGVYFYQLAGGDLTATRKMIIAR